jgi:hypothetical protein
LLSPLPYHLKTAGHKSAIERIVLLDFIHRLVSQKTNKIEELKI